ncbi:DUF4865 family protein [Streptomyces sp. B1866]|uniref:DUF4865 family protein n=1 Tax=Streptomyces sp. B1866 TaxID=3075431 RepID=UPI002891FDE2|nr:DUF4865 family protein [Streptomyces sp. B1866]MDT3398824.1 DUF4865 family protein [Streptomyces sp. B1866]
MHAMQYRITLPADYDMKVVRRRVEVKGPVLDGFPGLGLKAYALRERGVGGSPVNEYAPFYLWLTPEAANRFLWGPGFRGLVRDFGRPAVEQWQGLAFEPGPATAAPPRAAVRHTERIPEDDDPAAAVVAAVAALRERARTEGLYCAALGVDPRRWELVRYTLWERRAPESEPGDRYEVAHLSAPGRPALPEGRHW